MIPEIYNTEKHVSNAIRLSSIPEVMKSGYARCCVVTPIMIEFPTGTPDALERRKWGMREKIEKDILSPIPWGHETEAKRAVPSILRRKPEEGQRRDTTR
jgi:hypothetical protein